MNTLELYQMMSDGTNSVTDIVDVLRATGHSREQIREAYVAMMEDPRFSVEIRNHKVFFSRT